MRKYVSGLLLVLTLFLIFNVDSLVYAMDVSSKNTFRMRIIANSDKTKDQLIKVKVKQKIEKFLFPKLNNISSKKEMTLLLKKNRKEINKIINSVLVQNKIKYNYKILLGDNYFPEKEKYNQKFPAGKYTSLVIKLGKAKGKNWWCILFPPLCLMEGSKNATDKIEYTSFFAESIKKWFN